MADSTDTPVSAARAKAAARRQKILARENKTRVSAIGDAAEALPETNAVKERPLAARRSKVKSAAEKAARKESEQTTPSLEDSAPVEATNNDPEVESIEEFSKITSPQETRMSCTAELKKDTTTPSSSSSSSKQLPPKKTMKEIEADIARNTAQFDKNVLSKENDNSNDDDTTNDKRKTNGRNDKSGTAAGDDNAKKSTDDKQPRKKFTKTAKLEPGSVVRFVRMLLIIVLAAYKGYFITQRNFAPLPTGLSVDSVESDQLSAGSDGSTAFHNPLHEMLETPTKTTTITATQQDVDIDEFSDVNGNTLVNEFTGDAESVIYTSNAPVAVTNRTWMQWIYKKAAAPFDSSITAVWFAYWFANILAAPLTSRMKKRKEGAQEKEVGMLEKCMAWYQAGIDGFLERVYCFLGESALHLGSIVLVVFVLTLLYGMADTKEASWSSIVNAVMTSAGIVESTEISSNSNSADTSPVLNAEL